MTLRAVINVSDKNITKDRSTSKLPQWNKVSLRVLGVQQLWIMFGRNSENTLAQGDNTERTGNTKYLV